MESKKKWKNEVGFDFFFLLFLLPAQPAKIYELVY